MAQEKYGDNYSNYDHEALIELEREQLRENPKTTLSDAQKYWNSGGKKLLISEMQASHIRNCLNALRRANPNHSEVELEKHPTFLALKNELKTRY